MKSASSTSELPARDEFLWRPLTSLFYSVGCVVCRSRWTAIGRERIAAIDGPFLLASNHCSHVDTPVLQRAVPAPHCHRLAVIAARDFFGPPADSSIVRRLARLPLTRFAVAGHRAILIGRPYGSAETLRGVVRLVEDGWSVIIYPEGTRSRDGTLGSFRSGVATFARLCRRPVVPAWIQGSATAFSIGARWPRGGPISVRFGEPLTLGSGEDDERFTTRLRDAIQALGRAEQRA